jgi:hypothetical protein
MPPIFFPFFYDLMSCKLLVVVAIRSRGIADGNENETLKSLSACTHSSRMELEVQAEVKVILQKVERLGNIGKVRGQGSARALLPSFLPSDNGMHTECGIRTHQRKFRVTSLSGQCERFSAFLLNDRVRRDFKVWAWALAIAA